MKKFVLIAAAALTLGMGSVAGAQSIAMQSHYAISGPPLEGRDPAYCFEIRFAFLTHTIKTPQALNEGEMTVSEAKRKQKEIVKSVRDYRKKCGPLRIHWHRVSVANAKPEG